VEEVALVTLYAIAKNESGGYVTDLGRDDFRLFENGHPQEIDRFSAERRALRVAIVLDSSLSMSMNEDRIGAARDAALEFVDALEPGDEGLVATFSDEVRVLQELTSDREALRESLKRVETGGGTALYDAIWQGAERLREFDGRRVLVLLSDGRDEAASGLEPGSLHTLEEALDRAIRNDVMIFVIGLGGRLARDAKRLENDPSARASELDFFGRTPLASILGRIADTTGGRAIFSSSSGKVRRAFEEVAADLRHQYSIAYRSDDSRRDGSWREIRLTTVRPGVAVTSRSGYYAPRDRRTATP
jgi:VWFA-related protein